MEKDIFQFNSGLVVANLRKSKKTILDNIAFSLKPGKKIAVIGESGAGKTMMALEIMGLLPDNIYAENESIFFPNLEKAVLGEDIVYIPQNARESLNHRRTIKKHFEDGFKTRKIKKEEFVSLEAAALKSVGLNDTKRILSSYPFMLSGGEAQRVSIALFYGSKASLVIADEPTNGLDEKSIKAFFGLLKKNYSKAGIIIITHDISICSLCDKVLVIKDGKTIEFGNSCDILANPKNEYTKLLLEASYYE